MFCYEAPRGLPQDRLFEKGDHVIAPRVGTPSMENDAAINQHNKLGCPVANNLLSHMFQLGRPLFPPLHIANLREFDPAQRDKVTSRIGFPLRQVVAFPIPTGRAVTRARIDHVDLCACANLRDRRGPPIQEDPRPGCIWDECEYYRHHTHGAE